MDVKDKKIFGYLMQNSRLPYSKIASKVGLSKESVRRRVSLMLESKTIRFFKAQVAESALNLEIVDVYFRVKSNEAQQKVIKKLKKIRSIHWLGKCFGIYDVRATAKTSSKEKFLQEITLLKEYCNDIAICPVEQTNYVEHFKLNEKLMRLGASKIPSFVREKVSYKADEKDICILNELVNDARIPNSEIALRTSIHQDTVKYRIKNLEKKGVIKQYVVDIDGAAFGNLWVIALVKLKLVDKRLKEKIFSFCSTKEEIVSPAFLTSQWNFSMKFFAEDLEKLSSIITDFREEFYDEVIEYNLMLISTKIEKKWYIDSYD